MKIGHGMAVDVELTMAEVSARACCPDGLASPTPLGLSQPTVCHHLNVLKEAGLADREQRGTCRVPKADIMSTPPETELASPVNWPDSLRKGQNY